MSPNKVFFFFLYLGPLVKLVGSCVGDQKPCISPFIVSMGRLVDFLDNSNGK